MTEVYVIVLNWNGWKDTIDCLESIFLSDYKDFRVIVCDNASDDGSLDHIKAWAEGELRVQTDQEKLLGISGLSPVSKPITYAEYTRTEAESGGRPEENARLVLIQTGDNLGFAGGNNVGIRYAQARGDFSYVWILNNDTVVAPDALRHLVERASSQPSVGICGGTLKYFHAPDKIQALAGAVYNKWTALSLHIGQDLPADQLPEAGSVEKRMSYVTGACMLVSKSFLDAIGLMDEGYFLYFEELDWSLRNRGGFKMAYAPSAIIYHKEGGSISPCRRREKSETADFYWVRNRIRATRKFFPQALPTVYLAVAVTMFKRILRRQWGRIGLILRAVLDGTFASK